MLRGSGGGKNSDKVDGTQVGMGFVRTTHRVRKGERAMEMLPGGKAASNTERQADPEAEVSDAVDFR